MALSPLPISILPEALNSEFSKLTEATPPEKSEYNVELLLYPDTTKSFVVIKDIPLRMVILSLGLVGAIVVWFFVPTAQND